MQHSVLEAICNSYRNLTSNNNHMAAAKLLVDHFGTLEERDRVREIASMSLKCNSLPAYARRERDLLAAKYYSKMKKGVIPIPHVVSNNNVKD